MKLFELTGVKSQREKDMLQLLHDISTDGSKFKKAGEGVFAQVMVHENGTVYKFWAKDSAYEKFIEFVEKNPHNPHLPKLKSKVKELTAFFKKPKDFPDKIKYVKMEKLEPISSETYFTGSTELFATDVIYGIFQSVDFKDSVGTLLRELEEEEGKELRKEMHDAIVSLYDTAVAMEKFPGLSSNGYKKGTLNRDLHSGNIMKRGNVLVLTDPVNEANDTRLNKELLKQVKQLSGESGGNK